MDKFRPFLRWAGGKRWLARVLAPLLSSRLSKGGTYFEPFLGSGAIFFALQPERAVLSDLNEELIITFIEVAQRPQAIVERLSKMPTTREEYECILLWKPKLFLDRAVRFIYLNRNGYGGLYRENKRGIFNVPYGGGERNHKLLISDGTLLRAASALLQPHIELIVSDFGRILTRAGSGDVVYCDPTYRAVTHRQFDRYGRVIFGWEDQERLARLATEACERGATVVLSNTLCNGVRELYRKASVVEVSRRKGLGPEGNGARQVEYVFVLDPIEDWSFWAELGLLGKSL